MFDDPEDACPSIIKHALNSFDELGKLDLSAVERRNDPWLQLNYDAACICMEKVGDEVGMSATIPGPLTAAHTILPLDTVMKAMRKQPDKVHELLRFCTDAAKIIIDEMTSTGCGSFLSDPIASEFLISAKAFREFVFPYTKELMDYVHGKGLGMGYHVCGETNNILEDMVDTGCDVLSFDTQVDLADAKKRVGDRVTICGNIDVIHTLFEGTPADAEESVKEQLHQAYDSPKGFILSVSCDIPVEAPLENIDMVMDAARKYGKMPWNLELFAK